MDNIIWSGGYDSTALLLSKFNEECGYNVLSFYCDSTSNCEEDRKGRERVKEILSSHKNFNKFSFHEIEIKGSMGGIQGNIWPGLTLYDVSSDDREEKKVLFGYIRGDDFWHYRSHVDDIYVSLSKMLNSKITPVFPFEWSYKKDLIHLYSTNPFVFDSISWAGDTSFVKLKEKEELQTMLEQIKLSIGLNRPDVQVCLKKETEQESLTKEQYPLDFYPGKDK